jgi:hypothetical protein
MGVSGGPNIIRDSSLVLELDAADRNSYVSGSLIWNDLSGNNYHGTVYNNPTFSFDNGGNFKFNGVNSYIDSIPASSGSSSGNYTWASWCRMANVENYVLQRGIDGVGGSGWSILLGSLSTGFRVGVVTTSTGDTAFIATSSIVPNIEKWYYILGTWQVGVGVKLYINGNFESFTPTTTTNLRSSTSGWVLGRIITSGFYYNGYAANAHIYNRVLSDQEVLQNYNALKSRFNL